MFPSSSFQLACLHCHSLTLANLLAIYSHSSGIFSFSHYPSDYQLSVEYFSFFRAFLLLDSELSR